MASNKEDSCIGNDSSERKSVRILFLGDSGIGKTTLITKYLDVRYAPRDEGNIFEQYRAGMIHNGKEVDVGLFDLSPGSSAPKRRECYPTDVNTILLCFCIGNYQSLKSVYKFWIHEVHEHYGKLKPIFLVGLRRDTRLVQPLIDYSRIKPEDGIVEKSVAKSIQKNLRCHGDYMECSICDRSSVVNVIKKAFFAAMEDCI